jgi:hypothetical protein
MDIRAAEISALHHARPKQRSNLIFSTGLLD